MLIISFDPETDTPQKLKTYGENYNGNFNGWHFLTGDMKQYKKSWMIMVFLL